MAANGWSKTWTFFEGDWHEGNIGIVGPRTHALWLGSSVFDGARAFEGVTPDLDLHCARINNSAPKLSLKPLRPGRPGWASWRDGHEALRQEHAALHPPDVLGRARRDARRRRRPIRSRRAGVSACTRRRCRKPAGLSITLSPFRRPTHRMHAGRRQGGLPLSEQRARAARGERARLRQLPAARHARQRRGACDREHLLRQGRRGPHAGRRTARSSPASRAIGPSSCCATPASTVVEGSFRYADFQNADEIFSTGNYTKVMPVVRIDERSLQPGPFYRKARELYWDFAHS